MEATTGGAGRGASAWALHQILDLIQRGEADSGMRLPPERDLATSLGVSRSSVREAISALVTLGVLESRRGAGVFVTELDPTTVLTSLSHVMVLVADRHPDGIAHLHAQIEASTAARAAARVSTEGLVALEQALTELRIAAGEPRPRGGADSFTRSIARLSEDRFHRALARLAGDPVAEGMIALLRASRDRWHTGPGPALLSSHERLVDAIARREPEEARTLAAVLVADEFELRDEPEAKTVATRPRQAPTRATATPSQSSSASSPAYPDWFRDAKFGLIVHWGVYTVPGWAPLPDAAAQGWAPGHDDVPIHHFAEWYQSSASIPGTPTAQHHERVYGGRPYQSFRPAFESAVATWSPGSWSEQFASYGARYVVPVAKHHDGYLLWPSRVRHPHDQDWRAHRDVVGELAEAVRAHDMRFGLFYSSGVDWSFDATTIARPDDVTTSHPPGADYARYVDAHWRELIATYRPDGLWNDTGYPLEADANRVIEEYLSRVPDGVVTDRFRSATTGHLGKDSGEPWESVRPIGVSFGWNRAEEPEHVMSGPVVVCLLLDVVATNGNLLLGVSPDERGQLPEAQRASLEYVGGWLAAHGDGIYRTRPWGPRTTTTVDGRTVWFTCRDADLFVFIERHDSAPESVEIRGLDLAEGQLASVLPGDLPASHRSEDEITTVDLPQAPLDSPVTLLRITPAPSLEEN